MKAKIENNIIKLYGSLPSKYVSDNLNIVGGFHLLSDEIHKSEGFYDVIIPEYNQDTQILGEIYFDNILEIFTYPIIDKTQETIAAEYIQKINSMAEEAKNIIEVSLLKKLLADKIEALPEKDILEYRSMFKPYAIGISLIKDEKIYYPLNDKLYKVLQAHTTAIEWKPEEAVSLYVEITPPGVIAAWKQPLGAHDAYQIGNKVTHNGKTWECTVADNTWEPGVYGWVEIT